MNLIVDANIIFAVLIKSSTTEDLLFQENLNLFIPEFFFEEFEKYKETILSKTNRNSEDFDKFFEILKKRIKTIPNQEIRSYINEANKLSPDEKDIDYFALALKLKCPIWSNDKKLKEQDKVKIYSTEDLLEELEG